MKQMWKKSDPEHKGESWYSHKEGDEWCNGKAKPTQNYPVNQAPSQRDELTGKVLAGISSKLDRLLTMVEAITPVNTNKDPL